MVRIVTKTNPLGLVLGERIKVRLICKVDYEGNDRRLFFSRPPQVDCTVIGAVKRALGTFIPAKTIFYSFGDDDWEPAYLKVSRYVRLYECRTAIDSKPFLVQPEDVIL